MYKHLFVAATEWSEDKGGINVFNRSLVLALSKLLPASIKIHVVVTTDSKLPAVSPDNLSFHQSELSEHHLKNLVNDIAGESPAVLVGHDMHTGPQVVDAVRLLKSEGRACESAIVFHMDYNAYQNLKGRSFDGATERANQQRNLVLDADFVFAVGPLLKSSFEKLRSEQPGFRPVRVLIPGFPDLLQLNHIDNPSTALKFYFSGRINPEDDKVKNGRLTLHALDHSYKIKTTSDEPLWKNRGKFVVFGLENPDTIQDWFFEQIDRQNLNQYLDIELNPFSKQETLFGQLCDSHVAIMPSVHDGFGLSGWEAVCAGVPLICSDQSGLWQFLDSLFATNYNLHRESVVPVRVGKFQAEDISFSKTAISSLSDSLHEITRNYDRRRKHAKSLAEHMYHNYSWEKCAREVANELGLAPRGSVDWEIRKHVGQVAFSQKDSRSPEHSKMVDRAVDLANAGTALTEWSDTCTALNILSDLGKAPSFAQINSVAGILSYIIQGIEKQYSEHKLREPKLRCSGRFDVLWRLLAAASRVFVTCKQFLESIPNVAMKEILSDSFLRRELLYYLTRYSSAFENESLDLLTNFFEVGYAQETIDSSLQVRIARLESAFPSLGVFGLLSMPRHSEYRSETYKCRAIKEARLDVSRLFQKAASLGATSLALGTIASSSKRDGIDQVLRVWEEHEGLAPTLSWRGDKLFRASLLTTGIEPGKILELISSLANDEEEALRWAAIDIAFSPAVRERLFSASRTGVLKYSVEKLKAHLGALVDIAVEKDSFHPWMQREFLLRFLREYKGIATHSIYPRFTLIDFPISRMLLGPTLSQEKEWAFEVLHPEVEVVRRKLKEVTKRILLVLPPISTARKSNTASSTSTPPLGLGMVASRLLADGHDVCIADCHRTPELAEYVVKHSHEFDWLGFNVVLPTLRSVFEMASKIKSASRHPAIVVGGPAVNSRSFKNAARSNEELKCWDFEIFANSEENFSKLVADEAYLRTNTPFGIAPNSESDLVLRIGHGKVIDNKNIDLGWSESEFLDRRVFSTINGIYEPKKTRGIDSKAVEAHVVMSRGCDWSCAFCTERKQLSGGEKRRSVESVQQELEELAASNTNLRVQFIDDNLLPQIAAIPLRDIVARAKAVEWSKQLLTQLSRISGKPRVTFGWRGIFRVEDFLQYEREIKGFCRRLAFSGCNMLAFGVEHGNEFKRKKMKSSESVTNIQLVSLFSRLRDVGIYSKAYFIVGGPNETAETAEETIQFAIESKVNLAYFALYKDFVQATKILKNDQVTGSNLHESYSSYSELKYDWDYVFQSIIFSDDTWYERMHQILGDNFDLNSFEQSVRIYRELNQLGFKFSDLVKYNDYHSESGPSRTILEKLNFGNQRLFEQTVASAYMRFYLRPEFVVTYRELLSRGY